MLKETKLPIWRKRTLTLSCSRETIYIRQRKTQWCVLTWFDLDLRQAFLPEPLQLPPSSYLRCSFLLLIYFSLQWPLNFTDEARLSLLKAGSKDVQKPGRSSLLCCQIFADMGHEEDRQHPAVQVDRQDCIEPKGKGSWRRESVW